MIAKGIILSLAASKISALSVIQHLDGISIPINAYIGLGNANDITYVDDEDTSMRQTFSIDLVSFKSFSDCAF